MRFQFNFHNQALYLLFDKTLKKGKSQFRGSVTVLF